MNEIKFYFLTGKSTMVKLILGDLRPTKGYCELGSLGIKFNYYAQNQADTLDLSKTVLQTMHDVLDDNAGIYKEEELRALLGQFMFKGDDVYKEVGVLSGGEKARVALCRMMLTPANLLILDEVKKVLLYAKYF
jgi:ATP-binding cassette subfamily F protein 3